MGSRWRFAGPLLCWAGLAAAPGAAIAQNPAEQLETPSVRVIGVTPLPGFGMPPERIPANVQAVTGAEISRQQSINLPEFMSQRLPGVNINEMHGNPFQPDGSYRGFNASPPLGTPQGVSVHQDGVRVDQSFGGTVNARR